MNFESLKLGFQHYLEKNAQKNNNNPEDLNEDFEDVSIFQYASEFKDYMVNELNYDSSIKYEDIQDILNMQFIDGELVDVDEYLNENPDMADKIDDSQTLGALEGESEHSVEDESAENEAVVNNETTVTETPVIDTPSAETAQQEVIEQNVQNNEQIAQGQYITAEGVQNYSAKYNVQIEDPKFLTDALNALIKDDSKILEALDLSKDGSIDEEELKQFLDVIKCYDDNKNSISRADLLNAVKDIQDGVFRMKTDEQIDGILKKALDDEKKMAAKNKTDVKKKKDNTQNTTNTSSASNASGSYSGGGITVQELPKYDSNGNAILENMNTDELKKELNDAKGKYDEKKTSLEEAKTNKETTLQQLKDNEQKAYEEFEKSIASDSQLTEKLKDAKKDLDAKQEAFDNNNEQIENKKSELTEKKANLKDTKAKINDLTKSKNEYSNQLGSLEDQLKTLKSSKGNSDAISEVKAKISALKEKISKVEKEIEQAEKEKTNLENEINALKEELSALQEQKSVYESDLEASKDAMQDLENEILKAHPEVKTYKDAYDKAKQETEKNKATLEKNIKTAQDEVKKAAAYVIKVQSAVVMSETKDDIKQNYSSGDASELLDFAGKFEGMSESQVESICGYNLPNGLWCGAFCKYALTETYKNDLPSWYTNCNYNSCSDVLAAANNNNAAFTNYQDAQPGDLIIFNTSRGTARHIGIVTKVNSNGTVETIEGNSGGRVARRAYQTGTSRINSFVKVMR